MDKNIKYIGFYDTDRNQTNVRMHCLAATKKMDYVCECLNEIGYCVDIISPSWIDNNKKVVNKKIMFEKSKKIDLNKWKSLVMSPGYIGSGKYNSAIKILISIMWLTVYLLKNTNKNETVLVYHAPMLCIPLLIVKFFKKINLILEVEEIYSDVWVEHNAYKSLEKKLFDIADKYVVVSEMLKDKLPLKQSAILYGAYHIIDLFEKDKSNKIKVVYAGSIDSTKGGAINLAKACEFLNEKYEVIILGFGSDEDIKKLLEEINTNKNGNCIYLGLKTGDEFSKILFNCDIGANPQYVGEYMNTAFPSKILNYLSHNLMVLSTPVKSIVNSRLSNEICFSKSDSPKDIANAILNIDLNKSYSHQEKIKELHNEFLINLKNLIVK